MLDVRRICSDPDAVKAALARRGDASLGFEIDRVVSLEVRRRDVTARRDDIRARIRALSREVGLLRREGNEREAHARQGESRALGAQEGQLDAEYTELAEQIRLALLGIPNVPAEDAPDGKSADDNIVVRTVAYNADAYGAHQRVPHWEIGREFGIIDLDRAVKLSGPMFVMFRGLGARLVRALTSYALDRHMTGDNAYEEVRPPTLVRTQTMVATGNLPKFADEAYHVERDDLWVIPTAEAPLTSMARDEILDEDQLPLRFCAYTPCFRREAGAAGADTRGLLRSHEFDKVELFAYCTPEQAAQVHADVLARAEAIIADLGLAYRVLDLCTADLGFAQGRTFDLEVYAPGVDRWLEVSSVSWYRDYQGRRGNVRFRNSDQKGTEFVHTVNGSALAWSRIIPAILETHRQPDGTVLVPERVRPYLGGVSVLGRGG